MTTRHAPTPRAARARRSFRNTLSVSVATAVAGSLTLVPATVAAAPSAGDSYRGEIEVVSGEEGSAGDSVTGTVFVDDDRNSANNGGEEGLADVMVTNGRDVVRTDSEGRYELLRSTT